MQKRKMVFDFKNVRVPYYNFLSSFSFIVLWEGGMIRYYIRTIIFGISVI